MKEDNMKQGWEIKKLGEVCDIINGFAFKSNLFTDEGEYILRISNIQNGYIDLTDIAHFNKTDYPKVNLEKYAVLEDDIVVALSGATTGKFGINKTGQKLYLNQRVAICRENTSKLNHLYLLFYLRMQAKSFLESAEGVAQPNLSTELMKQIPIPVPPLPVQEQIVSKLDLLCSITEKKREQLKELDALAQSIFYDMFGDPITNEKGWEVKKLGEVCDDITDGDHMPPPKSETGIPFLTISDIDKEKRELNFNDTFFVPQEYYDNLKENRRAKKGDVLYTVTGSYGIPVIVNTCKHFCFQRHIALLKPKQENLLSLFLCQWFLCEGVKFMADQVATGIAQKTVSLTSIRKFEIILPPLPLQHQFASKIEAIEKQKELIKQSISETETLFNARMQEHFG